MYDPQQVEQKHRLYTALKMVVYNYILIIGALASWSTMFALMMIRAAERRSLHSQPPASVYGLPIKHEGGRRLAYRCNGLASWYLTLAVAAALHLSGALPLPALLDQLGAHPPPRTVRTSTPLALLTQRWRRRRHAQHNSNHSTSSRYSRSRKRTHGYTLCALHDAKPRTEVLRLRKEQRAIRSCASAGARSGLLALAHQRASSYAGRATF